ncbi:MAG TPA: hypothetical protein VL171_17460 [Verrucomicrobiae bacterium]|nr:hypothetical protein [Verrucomicrobiae bacterium]
MADEIQGRPPEESKKDTVRINLPPGLAGRGTPHVGPTPPPGAKIIPTPAPAASPEEEAKKETAVLGRPVDAPKPKKDTSRVQVVAARPSSPTVKLRRDEPAPAVATAPLAAPAAGPASRPMAAAPSGGDALLSLLAMVLSLGVVGYLAWIVFG